MFHTFTGSSRRPRQVNLSGRSSNPFAGITQSSASAHSPQSSAIQNAQQERKARQSERERLQASKVIQKAWKDHMARKVMYQAQREEWDDLMQNEDIDTATSINLLVRFMRPRHEAGDFARAIRACGIFLDRVSKTVDKEDPRWKADQGAFGVQLIEMLNIILDRDLFEDVQIVILTLQQICEDVPEQMAVNSIPLFKAMSQQLRSKWADWIRQSTYTLLNTVLQQSVSQKREAHQGLVALLECSWLQDVLNLDHLATAVDPGSLALALQDYLNSWKNKSLDESHWILAQYIYLYKKSSHSNVNANTPSNRIINLSDANNSDNKQSAEVIAHISSLTTLMSIMSRYQSDENTINEVENSQTFLRTQIESLVDQETISRLLTCFEVSDSSKVQSDYASTLASYVLTLIQLFPRRSDEIRMWIYLGSANMKVDGDSKRLPAIKYFWQAFIQSSVFREIHSVYTSAVKLLSPQHRSTLSIQSQELHEQEWKTCLLFLELYSFVLKIMDDDEFMSADKLEIGYKTWTRQSALHLDEIKDLTIFLKNLAFAMYWNAAEITTDNGPTRGVNLRQYFSPTDTFQPILSRSHLTDPLVVRGVQSSSLIYIKGTVTGLLRMLYERDSRRRFLPEQHWLMPQVEMTGFIQAVLEEQHHKDEHVEQEIEDDEEGEEIDTDQRDDRDLLSLVGAQRTQYVRRVEQIRKQQQKAFKRRRLEETLPRLNILENMPFFIPFHVRVQIFRQFVRADQEHRRNGHIDPDLWRMSIMHSGGSGNVETNESFLRSRSARVRREHVMEDAFEQLYALGEGLKEPIQITFVDQFDTPEAGIDGGGVTKEFLTSVTEEAFKKSERKLFMENSQHLLYPNPALIDEEKFMLEDAGIAENSREWQWQIKEALSRYSFLGRIVGKCLYEGILIDVHFAPFFLVKWALTGGRGSATNESGYRATINDLKALDEELYKGLLDLKNYSGNAEDFALDFTITDEISTEDGPLGAVKITRELRPDGGNIPVTNENKLVYISYVARHRLQIQPHQQTSAFLRGLGDMIQPSWLSMFNQSELQTLIGGDSSEIDVADLRRNTLYGGVYQIGYDGQEHPTVKLFWDVMRELSDGDRRKFLKYVTSTPRAPLLGFSQLRPPFSIRDSGSDQQRLPSTSTCVNLLKLPIYKTKEVLRDKLLYAITSGAGFDLS